MIAEGISVLGIILFLIFFIMAVIAWGYSFYYMIKTLGNLQPDRKWGVFIAFALFIPWFFTEQGNVYRKQLLKYSGYFILICLLGITIGIFMFTEQTKNAPNQALQPTTESGG